MHNDVTKRHWKRLRGSTQEQQGNLTGNDLDRTEGKIEKLADTLHGKYGHARAKADNKIERRLRDSSQKHIAVAMRARRVNKRQSIGW